MKIEKKAYPGIAMGGKIYSLRAAKGLTQEQLAQALCISPAAVSKWERNLSVPGIEMSWALADFFDCSIDELVGRVLTPLDQIDIYNEERLRLASIGDALLKCSEISREKGLLAMEEALPRLKTDSRFLAFAVPYIMNLFLREAPIENAFTLLKNYVSTLPPKEQAEGHMIAAVLKLIFAGNGPELIQEEIASHIGIGYREKLEHMREIRKYSRQELLLKYQDKKLYNDSTALLEELVKLDDFHIQVILRNTEIATLIAALAGASGSVAVSFLQNLSDRMLYLICEDLEHWQGTETEIIAAQRKMLEIAGTLTQADISAHTP